MPAQEVTCDELDARLGLRPGTSYDLTGVRRRFLTTDETAAQLGAKACEAALANAGLAWSDIDCLVGASCTMDQALPYNAALIHAELGLSMRRTATFDIGASCMSFLAGLDVLSHAVEGNQYRNVMLVSADIATFGIDWTRLREGGIFGDGAAAAVICKAKDGEGSRILASRIATISEGAGYCRIPAGGSRHHPRRPGVDSHALSVFHMEGKSVFKLIAEELPGFVENLMEEAGLKMSEIALVVPHQGSQQAIRHMAKRLGVSSSQLVDIFQDYGNQVGASLPTALHIGLTQRSVRRGDPILMIGTGAGLTMGGMVLTY